MNITYNTKIIFNCQEDYSKILKVLESQRYCFNECSKVHFDSKNNSITELHGKFYRNFRGFNPEIPAQIVVRAINETLATYRTIKSNRHKIQNPPEKKRNSIRLDKKLYKWINGSLKLTTLEGRITVNILKYPKLEEYLSTYRICDPLLFERDGEIWIALTFDIPEFITKRDSACGVDLGIRMAAVTSEGKFYRDKKFNGRKRKLRFLKRKLQSKGTKSAKRHLKKVRRKERNINKNQSHLLANSILRNCKADVLVLEDLSKIKAKKNKFQNKNAISQTPFFQLKQILSYKAPIYRKTVISVNPRYTSQIDHRTGEKDGTRQGRRYYGQDGVVLDADQNAAINIAKRSKHPVSYITVLDGQATVNSPIVCKSLDLKISDVLQATML